MIKHLQAWLLWILGYWLIRLPLIILGFLVFPIAYITKRKDNSLRWLFWIYDNLEDGIYGPEWFNAGRKNLGVAFKWSVIRNPVNNMRFTFLGLHRDHLKDFDWEYKGDHRIPTPKIAKTNGGSVWHYSIVWNGYLWYPSFWYIKAFEGGKHFRVRAGWKCTYKWILNKDLSKTGKSSGITLQFLPYRNG